MRDSYHSIDYQQVSPDHIEQRVNWSGVHSSEESWKDLGELFKGKNDFVDLMFMKLTGTEPRKQDRQLLLKSLLLISSGTGYHAPSVFIPRMVSTTTKNEDFAVINGLISGLCSMGTHHLGAISGVMKSFEKLKQRCLNSSVREEVEVYVSYHLQNKKAIQGFGHPVYKKDNRATLLAEHIISSYDNVYVDIYRIMADILYEKKGIHPNIDGALALAYLTLGFKPSHGIYLSFFARSLNMMSHILDEQDRKPFSFLNHAVPLEQEANKRFQYL